LCGVDIPGFRDDLAPGINSVLYARFEPQFNFYKELEIIPIWVLKKN